jgi:hypothetical protein
LHIQLDKILSPSRCQCEQKKARFPEQPKELTLEGSDTLDTLRDQSSRVRPLTPFGITIVACLEGFTSAATNETAK